MKTQEEVIRHLKSFNYEADAERTIAFKNRHCEYGNGNATIKCINTVFGTDFK